MMDLYVGLLLQKQQSGRLAQIAALDPRYAYLSWDDGKQTKVNRERFQRTNEWSEVVGYQEADTHPPLRKRPGYPHAT